jgi:uncharacterized protein YndB with AHSA1/START domain
MQFGEIITPTTFRLERTLKAPIDRVWSYFVDSDKRSRWFTGDDSFSANGQVFSILFAHRNITNEKPPERWAQMESGQFPMTGRVLAFDPRVCSRSPGAMAKSMFLRCALSLKRAATKPC